MKRWLGAVVAVALVACGGDDGGSGTVQGAVAGQGMQPVQDAIYLSIPTGLGGNMGVVFVSDHPGLCELLEEAEGATSSPVRDASMLMLVLANVQGTSFGAVDAGTYPVISMESEEAPDTSRFAMALFDHVNASGTSTVGAEAGSATGGSVTLSSAKATQDGGAKGTFSVQFGTDALTGAFDAAYCDADLSMSTVAALQRPAK